MRFLSCESNDFHKEHLNTLKLRLSVFEASYSSVHGADYRKISGLRIPRSEKCEILALKAEIEAHELFFNSFVENSERCCKNEIISGIYGSEVKFLYDVLRYAIDKSGFLIFYLKRSSSIGVYAGPDYARVLMHNDARLAVDLFEHAYFTDYGFDKEKYLSRALSNLNLSMLNTKNMLQNQL